MRAKASKRIWELDFLRGLSILLVVFDHAMIDFYYVFSNWQGCGVAALEWLHTLGEMYVKGNLRFFWRPAFLFIFFFTSGLCTAFSRNNFLRGLRLTICAALVSVVTYYVEKWTGEEVYAMFGVLHCMAVIILLYAVTELIIKGIVALVAKIKKAQYDKRIERVVQISLCLTLGVIFCIINHFYNVPLADVTGKYIAMDTDSKILGLFFYCNNWWTADYFPLFPYIAFFFLGAGCTRLLYEKRRSLLPMVDGVWNGLFKFAGRHSLVFYLGGQVAVIALSALASLIALGSLF